MDSHIRSIVKSLSWRMGGLVVTLVVAYAITRQAALAASIGVADTVVKLFAYYIHERAWLKIRFGQRSPSEYEI
jgi:uncharacterized membrane protein